MILRLLATALFATASLVAQVSFGLIAGVPFNNLTNGSNQVTDKSGMFTVGHTVQVSLPFGFRLEADALYRPLGYSTSQWRFPVLAQYRLKTPIMKPFVEAGYSYDHANLRLQRANASSTPAPSLSVTSHHGFVIGAGVDFKIPLVRISPEIRYTHDLGAIRVGNLLNTNQAELLVGFRF
jgi:hypothetical protein